jgi:hypothetical protein
MSCRSLFVQMIITDLVNINLNLHDLFVATKFLSYICLHYFPEHRSRKPHRNDGNLRSNTRDPYGMGISP